MKFYSRYVGSTIHVTVERFGTKAVEAVEFVGGCIDTEDPQRDDALNKAIEAHCAPIADRAGSNIFTRTDIDVEADVRKAQAEEIRKAAEVAQTKAVAAGLKT